MRIRSRCVPHSPAVILLMLLIHAVSVSGQTLQTDPVRNIELSDADWASWRGPFGNGAVPDDAAVPLEWSNDSSIAWEVQIPGRGHGSAVIAGDLVFITSADHTTQEQALHCLDRRTGQTNWKTVIHKGGLAEQMNRKATAASSTPACDGHHVFVTFHNSDAVYCSAVSLTGEVLWQQKISDYVIHQGYGASPFLYRDLVIVSADNKGGGAVCGLAREDGRIRWRLERPAKPNYASPIVVRAADRDQLILTGCDLVVSCDPLTGKVLWETEGATTECVSTTVTDGTHIYSSGGYPKNHIAAYKADGSAVTAWESGTRVYVPSMLLREGHIYGVTDAGVAFCRNSADGSEQWKVRVEGTYSSSPIMVGQRMYCTSEEGITRVLQVSPDGGQILSTSRLGDETYSTMAVSRGCLFVRIARNTDDGRRESLVCIGDPQ